MQPLVPAPLQPTTKHNKAVGKTSSASKEATKLKALKEDAAIEALSDIIQCEIRKVALELGQSEHHVRSRVFFETKPTAPSRRVSGFNAVVHAVAEKENQGKYLILQL